MLRAIKILEDKLDELFRSPLPKFQEEAQEQIRTIDDIEQALKLLKEAEEIDD
jgi:hypothetical protein